MNREVSSFVDKYVKEIKANNAAMFIGAGFSKSAGYVDWRNLLRGVAEDLGLDVDKEYDRAVSMGAQPVFAPTTEPWGQRTCYVADPEGNLIEISSFVE